MSRSGYSYDYDSSIALWRGAVESAINGKRGQAILCEMLAAFDAMPEKKLIARELEKDGCVCALGAVGKARGLNLDVIDPEDPFVVADVFNIAGALAAEIAFMNDEAVCTGETPEQRFVRMRKWVSSQIRKSDK